MFGQASVVTRIANNKSLNRSGGWERNLKSTSLAAARLAQALGFYYDAMDKLILDINPEGYLIHFNIFTSVTVILAFLIYMLLSTNRFRRLQYKTLGTLKRTSSLLLVLPLAGLAIYYFYNDDWGYFFTLKKHSQTIELGYYYPKRAVTLDRPGKITIHTASYIRKSGLMFRLVLKTENGTEYKSQLISQYDLGNVIDDIENTLSIKVKT